MTRMLAVAVLTAVLTGCNSFDNRPSDSGAVSVSEPVEANSVGHSDVAHSSASATEAPQPDAKPPSNGMKSFAKDVGKTTAIATVSTLLTLFILAALLGG